MTSRVPQLIISLSPEGKICCELPGSQGTRRKLDIATSAAGETLLRILEAQGRGSAEIGLDGAPTQKQVLHWERHATWASASCRFCLAEGRAQPDHKRVARAPVLSRPDGVQVRRLPPGKSFKHKTLETKRSIADLDL